MTHSKWLYGFGAFLFLCGLAGYLSNPVAAKTALMSGSVFGALSILWGFLLGKSDHGWVRVDGDGSIPLREIRSS